MEWVIVILSAFILICGLYLYLSILKPLRRLYQLTEQLATGRPTSGFIAQGGLGIRRIIANLESIDARLSYLRDHASEEKFSLQGILTSMIEGVLVVDSNKTIRLANDALVRFFQLNSNPIGKTIMEGLRNADVQRIIDLTIREGKRQTQEITIQFFEGETSTRKILEVNAVPLTEKKRSSSGVVVVFHDLTFIKKFEEGRRDFVANVSHELRTPLSIFKGYLETLLDNPKWMNDEAQRITWVLQRHSDRLNMLVNDLLTLTRIESGVIRLNPEPMIVPEFLEQILVDWKRMFEEKPCELAITECPENLEIDADPLRMEQVFNNLLENALKYCGNNGRVALSCVTLPGNRHIRFTIEDNGIGIPSDKLPHIFERFFRVDPARSRELGGTGLGLCIVKNIVILHGGSVRAESQLGKGTKIIFDLPIRIETPALAKPTIP